MLERVAQVLHAGRWENELQLSPDKARSSLQSGKSPVDPNQPVTDVGFRGGQSDRRGGLRSPFRRSPTSVLAVIGARTPLVCFCCSEQSSITVAAVGIPVELARTHCRHRTCL